MSNSEMRSGPRVSLCKLLFDCVCVSAFVNAFSHFCHCDSDIDINCVCVKDERNQVLIAYLWIRQTWHDAYLKWNKEDYDGLEVIHIPSSLVWRPDLVLYNKYARTSHTHAHTHAQAMFHSCQNLIVLFNRFKHTDIDIALSD